MRKVSVEVKVERLRMNWSESVTLRTRVVVQLR